MNRRVLVLTVVLALLGIVAAPAGAEPGGCPMASECPGGGGCKRGGESGTDDDHAGFRFLLQNHDRIRRDVKKLPDGVETVTESDDPEVAAGIRRHVAAMARRLKEGRPIHARDPLFAELFRHAGAIVIVEEPTDEGIRVRETSQEPYVVELIQAHAEVVNGFVARGMAEMHRDHAQQQERDLLLGRREPPGVELRVDRVGEPGSRTPTIDVCTGVADLAATGAPRRPSPDVVSCRCAVLRAPAPRATAAPSTAAARAPALRR